MVVFHPLQQSITWTASMVKTVPYLANGDMIKGSKYFMQGYTAATNSRAAEAMVSQYGLPPREGGRLIDDIINHPNALSVKNSLNFKAQAAQTLASKLAQNRNGLQLAIVKAEHLANVATTYGMAIPDFAVKSPSLMMGYMAYLGEHAETDRAEAKASYQKEHGSLDGYDEGKTSEQIHANAVRNAVYVLDRTQPAGSAEDSSGMMRNPNHLLSVFTMCKLWDSVSMGKLMTFSEGVQRGLITKGQYASNMAADILLEPMAQAALHTYVFGKGATLGAFGLKAGLGVLGTALTGLGGGFGLAGGAVQYAAGTNKAGAPKVHDDLSDSISLPWLSMPIDTIKAPIQDLKHPDKLESVMGMNVKKIYYDSAKAIAFWTGVPAYNTVKDFNTIYEDIKKWSAPHAGDDAAIKEYQDAIRGYSAPSQNNNTKAPSHTPSTLFSTPHASNSQPSKPITISPDGGIKVS